MTDTDGTTDPSLLNRIRDPEDGSAWGEFLATYSPVIYRYARGRGLQEADAEDLVQEVLRSVSRSAARLVYDHTRGGFRAWLYTITRNELADFLAARARRVSASGDTEVRDLLEAIPAPDDNRAAWDRECEERLFGRAVGLVRGQFTEASWRAFWLTAVDGLSPAEVASQLGMSVGAVYIAKSRAIARLRQAIGPPDAD